jgi:hypothetical protein
MRYSFIIKQFLYAILFLNGNITRNFYLYFISAERMEFKFMFISQVAGCRKRETQIRAIEQIKR